MSLADRAVDLSCVRNWPVACLSDHASLTETPDGEWDMDYRMKGGLAALAVAAASSAFAEGRMPRFGWGAPVERTREMLGSVVSGPRPCSHGWGAPLAGCQALFAERHRLGKFDYRLELQHHPVAGLNRIVVVPAATSAQARETATAYAILVFDAAFSESHGRLASFPVFKLADQVAGKSGLGYEWIARYGPPGMRVRLHARVLGAGDAGMGLAIEQ